MKICKQCKKESTGETCPNCSSDLVDGFICDGRNAQGTECGAILGPDDYVCNICRFQVKKSKQKEDLSNETKTEDEHESERSKNTRYVKNSDMESSLTNQTNCDTGYGQFTKEDRKSDGENYEMPEEEGFASENEESFEIAEQFNENPEIRQSEIKQPKSNDTGKAEVITGATSSQTSAGVEPTKMKSIPRSVEPPRSLITVNFRAITSHIKCDGESITVLLEVFQNGSSQRNKDVMTTETRIEKENDKVVTVVLFEKVLPKSTVVGNKITYSYTIQKNGKSESKSVKHISKKMLQIPSEYHKVDVWDQYDGLLYKDHKEKDDNRIKTFIKKGVDYVTGKTTDAEKSAGIYGQVIVDSILKSDKPMTFYKIRQTCAQIFIGLENFFNSEFNEDLIKKMHFNLWFAFENGIKIRYPKETHQQAKGRFLLLVSMLYLSFDYKIELNEDSKDLVCERVLLKPHEQKLIELDLLDHLSEIEREELCDVFLDFSLKVQYRSKNPRWLYLVPFIHFLNGQSHQHEKTPRDYRHDASQPAWWGIQKKTMENIVNHFKQERTKQWPLTCSLQALSACLKPLFGLDYLLPRTVIASLNFLELKDAIETQIYPVEILCAALIYHVKTQGNPNHQYLMMCLEGIFKQITSRSEDCEMKRWLRATISGQLLEELTKKSSEELVCKSAEIFTFCMTMYNHSLNGDNLDEKVVNKECVLKATGNVISMLMKECRMTTDKIITVWNKLLMKKIIPSDSIIETWNNSLKNAIRTSLKKRIDVGDNILILTGFCKNVDQMEEDMQEIMYDIVQKAVPESENLDTSTWTETAKQNLKTVMRGMFLKEWDTMASAQKEMDKEMNITAFLSWPSLPFFLRILYKGNNLESIDCSKKIHAIKESIDKIVSCLWSGNIAINELKILSEQKKPFCEMVKYLECRDSERVGEVLEIRVSEFKQYGDQKIFLEFLKNLCSSLPSVDTGPIDEIFQREKECCALNRIVVVTVDNPLEQFSNTDRVQICSSNDSLKNLVNWVEGYRNSQLFGIFWNDECRKQQDVCKTLHDIETHVMTSLKERLNSLSNRISIGEITFREMEQFFGDLYHESYDKMRNDLALICKDECCIDKRIEQLRRCRSYQKINEIAYVMMDLKDVYSLDGNFDPFKNSICGEFDDKAFNDFEESLTIVSDLLKEMNQEKIKCLKAFVTCHELVLWLRETMKESGLSECTVFVDLATISAGESAEKMEMVKSLHAGVNAYAPLIFDLKSKIDCMELIAKCKAVWRILHESPQIYERLLFANQHLHWFKHVKNTKGDVEITSFVEANTINESGIFTIGLNAEKNNQEASSDVGTNTDLSDVIKLTVPKDEDQGRIVVREYSLSELEELESKLMLVVGEAEKGKENVERFTMLLDGVIRLSKVYIRLVTCGCVLFTNFAIKLFCEPNLDTPVCVILEFKNGEELIQLKCRKTKEERLENIMPKVASQMEKCLEDWIEFVNHNRDEYPHLNYFTMDQLVILQKEIAKISLGKEPAPQLFPLLHFAKSNCNKEDVANANKQAIVEIEKKQTGTHNQEENVPAEHEDPKRNEFINKLVKAKYERLVPFAIEQFPDFNTSKALYWCMRNKSNIAKFEAERRARLQNTTDVTDDLATGDSQPMDTIDALMRRSMASEGQYDSCEFMLARFAGVWKDFIHAIISSLKDFISLKQLGVLLHHLAIKEEFHHNRPLHGSYKESSPNLVICETDKVLITTLSVYMFDKSSEDLPLPQSDEVLMCSANTSLEKVDVFLRRAIFFSNGKIHCIVNADLMDFHVCEGLYNRLQEYVRRVNERDKYRLVIICGSEKEHSLSMISSLEKYRRHPHIVDLGQVKTYIERKLKLQVEKEKAAAAVDFNKSTVRLVLSRRSGVGKTLYKKRREEELKRLTGSEKFKGVTLPLHQKRIDLDYVIGCLLQHTKEPGFSDPRLFHIDVTNEVQEGVDYLLFNLLILGCLVHKNGYIWRKSCYDLYLIETMVRTTYTIKNKDTSPSSKHQMLNLLPTVTCRSPEESLKIYKETLEGYDSFDQLFDDQFYNSDLYQKPYDCLLQLEKKDATGKSQQNCLETLLKTCLVKDPSWSELYHFVSFLHTQIVDFEKNQFVSTAAKTDLPGFDTFVQKFLIQMSKDFSSRSLNMSEETDAEVGSADSGNSDELSEFQIKRTWESSPHPYLFFNADHFTFTFLGFNIDRGSGNLIDIQTKTVLEKNIMTTDLYDRLVRNGVPIQEDFDTLSRALKIKRLCTVMDITPPSKEENDPDITYELTTDNVKKMMAIYMRFRCNIPVVIMGETGCGKTRLVKFLCDLMALNSRKESGETAQNMIIVKVHGGTTNLDIKAKVKQAEQVAKKNLAAFGENLFTVLFFDEANTTESIGLLKEIMCDKTMDGLPLTLCKNLKLVAACNPYRRHPKNLINKLEKAGLGYNVRASETTDRLGRIPLRRLVYRVHPLPQSMLPFVWDFGQLSTEIEGLYIQQMVKRYMNEGRIRNERSLLTVISKILTHSQEYMRTLKDECSFVSLRDVDRVLQIMCWFYNRLDTSFFKKVDEKLKDIYTQKGVTSAQFESLQLSKEARSLVLALGVCYHACLSDRHKYREYISKVFSEPCALTGGPDQIQEEIDCCQEVFLDAISLEEDIARNLALKENVFMMVICVELRIPLFLVGKPGSSKSLARLKVADAMQGNAAKNDLFKEMKQAQMLSFQCSPLSTPDSIIKTFRQCADFQKTNNLDKFVSVVVLDEVGLAEDSQKMPLKTLHPLLEDGCQGDETSEPYKKVGFIGISNWALDPAKMNRGIFVQRGVPDSTELEETAKGICQKTLIFTGMEKLIHELSTAYLKVFSKATESKREFFGLRDFYCLMKMVNKFVEDSKRLPTFHQLRFALRRNFSGLETMDAVDIFFNEIQTIKWKNMPELEDPDDSFKGLIDCCLLDTSSRHLLLITENYSALSTFQEHFLARKPKLKPNTIFGSSFRRDQEYTQVCRNINRIKVCMEAGSTVVLLNSENLYESLYETLNQYYVVFGGQSYVDLGLGTHRVKCPVHKNFKLIVVAEKQTVYDKFPIPLINRLEKHNLTSNTLLTVEQLKAAAELRKWAIMITKHGSQLSGYPSESDIGKVIIGFHDDACSALVLHIWEQQHCRDENEHKNMVLEKAKEYLLWCATPDAIVRICNNSPDDKEIIEEIYWKKQAHESISEYLRHQLATIEEGKRLLAQVTTRTKLLATVHQAAISESCGLPESQVLIIESLTTFDTEQQFNSKIRDFLRKAKDAPILLIIQCDTGDEHSDLIACARYSAMDECSKANRTRKSPVHIVIVVQLPTLSHRDFKSIQCGEWHSVHIDHLHSVSNAMPDFHEMQGKSMATLVDEATKGINTEIYENSSDTNPGADVQIEKRCIDLKQILSMCVQRAMSMVRDTGEGFFRITDTISLVLSLLHTDDFAMGIGILLARLLEDRDKSLVPHRVNNWLSLEAATLDMIQKTGTLRRACLQTFERKLSPGLAGIIAYLNTNQNILIIRDKISWKYDLWIRMLNRTDIFSLTYRGVVKQDKDKQGKDKQSKDDQPVYFVVRTTGFEEHFFNSKMPFSWLIYNKLSEIVKCDTGYLSEIGGKGSNLAFEETPIMKVLISVPEDCHEEAIDCYVNDFVHMVYASNEENEMTIVCEMIKQETNVVENTELSTALINVHIAFKNLSLKLKYFCEINRVWGECSRKLLCLSGLPENHVLRKYKCTDRVLQALYLLIDELSPTDEHSESVFNDSSSRSTWLVKVQRCRYVVQRTFSEYAHIKDTDNENTLMEARSMWNQVVVMQLFLENVCKSSSDENITIELCDPLWMQLSEDKVDMKKIATLEKVQEFLGTCFELAKDEYERKQHRCSHCSKVLSDTSRKLPCNDEVCAVCIQTMPKENMFCPSCQTRVEIGFFDKAESRYISGKDRLEDYQRRCTVFLMDIVSQLCFSENQAPDTDVIERLMSYSLESEITSAGVDQSHAFKTFIFKLLIRTSEKEFRHQLEKYLAPSETDTTDSEDSTEDRSQEQLFQKEELLLIIARCIEDNINEKALNNQNHVSLDEAKALLYKLDSTVDQLEGIARSRICLANAAHAIHRQVFIRSKEDGNIMLNEEDNRFLTEIKEFCDSTEEIGPWKYLVKFLYRCYGIDIVTAAFKSNNLLISWIHRNELKSQEPDRIDRYITCGEKYCKFKEYLTGPVGTQGAENLIEFVQSQGLPQEQGCVYLHMAMYYEIISKCQRNADKVKLRLTCLEDSNVYCGNRAIVLALANNDLTSFHMDIESQAKEMEINIKSLAFQWMSILLNVEEQSTCGLLKTLIKLAKHPHEFADAFLPTMEQDDMHEFIALLREGEYNDIQNVYRCKNGHPYVIRDCGRPWYKGKCPCGAKIGGELHKLEETNVQDDGSDKTLTGHILGQPENRKNGPGLERDLKPINCACIRLLLHLTMYVSCSRQQYQIVHKLIKADIEQSQTVIFLLGHIEKDIEDIRGVLNLNIDDVLIFCHNLLDSFIENSASSPKNISYSWDSKKNRQQWENEVDKKYICQVVQNCVGILKSGSDLLKENNYLVTLLSEDGERALKDDRSELLCKNPMFWMYRVPVTFSHMKNTFQRKYLSDTKNVPFPLLKHFLEKEHALKGIRYIPSILKLQRTLLRKFSQRFYKKNMKGMTVRTLKKDEETEGLIKDVVEAWDIARLLIVERKHFCLSEYGKAFVPKELCDIPITDDTEIEILLPNTDDKGICSFAMLEIFMQIQNEFLDEYLKISKSNGAEVSLSTVCPKEITSAHLISFDTLLDIQPLILANCSFHVRDSNIVYEFENFERQLVDRFVSTKSKLITTPFLEIDTMVYRTDASVSDAMLMLERKIKQEPLTPVMKNQICGDFKDFPDICQILSSLDIALRVLNVTGGEEETLLYEFMVEKLKMNRGVLTFKIQKLCKLSHVKSLWMTLSIQKAVIMITHDRNTKEVFEAIDDSYHEPVPEKNQDQFTAFLQRQSSERLHMMLDIMFEYIILKVSVKENEEDEDFMDMSAYPLKECIIAYASEIEREEEMKFVTDKSKSGYDFPEEILLKHCLSAWALIAKQITQSKAV